MKYIIIKKFGPDDDRWQNYAQWAGLQNCQEYYSIDGMNSESLFKPESAEDWDNCINEDFKTHIITNLIFAKKIIFNFSNGEIIGVIENPKSSNEKIPPNHTLLGYDIIDGYKDISLLTNWGGKDGGIKNLKLNKYALIDNLGYAYDLKDMLHRDFSEDSHAAGCEVWAIYRLNA